MINVSSEFRQYIYEGKRNFLGYLDITLTDGTVLNLENSDIWENGFKIDSGVSSANSFDIGAAVSSKLTVTLNNIYDKFSPYDFDGATVVAYVGLQLSTTLEKLRMGTFIVDEPTYNGTTITLECLDYICKLKKSYSLSSLVYPATIANIVRDACSVCGVTLLTTTFDNGSYVVKSRPSDEALTFLDVVAFAAQVACKFVKADSYGRIKFDWYAQGVFEKNVNLDGGFFDGGSASKEFALTHDYQNTTDGMTKLRDGVRQDDGVDTVTGVDWFSYNGVQCNSIYVSGNHWIGFGASAEHLKVCRRDGAMYYLYRQEGEVNGVRFLKIRWEGYTRYNYTTDEYALKFEVFLVENGNMFLNVIQTPTLTSYLGTSALICNGVTIPLEISDGSGAGVRYVFKSSNSISWEAINESVMSYLSGDNADGGSFNPWDSGYVADAGTFADQVLFHHIYTHKGFNVATDDVVITGIEVTEEFQETDTSKRQTYQSGNDGYVLSVSGNKFIQSGQAKTVADYLATKLVGLSFRPMSTQSMSDPTIEAGDLAYVTERRSNTYKCLITNLSFNKSGYESLSCDAETPRKNSSVSYSAATKAIVEARQNTEAQLTAYDLAVQQLNQLAANTMGFYASTIKLEDGSTLSYRHDKPTLAESKIVYKTGIEGFFVTEDYQGTDEATEAANKWSSGFDSEGNATVNILSAIGIVADWIKAGLLESQNGNSYWNLDTGELYLDGTFISESAKNMTELDAGHSKYYYNSNYVGRIGASSTTSNYYGLSMAGYKDYIGFSTQTSETSNPTFNYVINNGMNPNGYEERHIFYGSSRFTGAVTVAGDITTGNYLKFPNGIYFDASGRKYPAGGATALYLENGGLYVNGAIGCLSGQKYRIVDTFIGKVGMSAVESASPVFQDYGSGIVDETGICYIYLDPLWMDTITITHEYYVQLTRTSPLTTDYVDKQEGFFIVRGEPTATFDWVVTAKQKGYETDRMESVEIPDKAIEYDDSIFDEDNKIEALANQYLCDYEKEIEI